jgi:predicted PurR-regulated permease PerM
MGDRVRIRRSQISLKTALTFWLTAFGIVAAVYFMSHTMFALTLVLMSALIAVALDHLVSLLVRRKAPRGVAIAGVMVALLAVGTGIGLLIIPPAITQGRAFADQLPSYAQRIQQSAPYQKLERRFGLDERLSNITTKAPQQLPRVVDPALKAIGGVVTFVGAAVTLFFLVIFMLGFGGRLVRTVLNEAVPHRRERYEKVLGKIYASVGGYLSGLTAICFVNAVMTTTFLAIARVPFFLPLGILSGVSSLIPLAGNVVAGTFISLVALITGGIWKGVAAAIYYIVYQQFENHVLGPIVYRKTVDINPLVVIVAVLFAAELAGIIGAIVAVPVAAVLQIIAREVMLIRREQLRLPKRGPVSGPGNGQKDDPAQESGIAPQHLT